MTTVPLPDGSTVTVEPFGVNGASVARSVGGKEVWGQVFSWQPYDERGRSDPGRPERELTNLLGRMAKDPSAYERWWFTDGSEW